MINDFIYELETLTNQQITTKPTELGFLLVVNPQILIHFIELSKINNNLDLPAWKTLNNLTNTISVFENDWWDKREGVISRIKSKLGLCNKIYARKTTVKKLNRPEAYHFLLTNHINDALKAKYNFGLMYNNELVAIACFGPIMHKKTEAKGEQSGELIRFCNKLDTTVVGGLSKLLKYFITQYQVDDVMTYIDKDWSEGSGFIKLGFEIVREKTDFFHYFDTETKQFVSEVTNQNKIVTIYKSGLLKLLLKLENKAKF